MVYSDTLIIRNLPATLSIQDKKDFIKYFGAINVVVLDPKHRKKSIAFAKFESNEIAKTVLFRLHQKELLGERLVVEFADSKSCISYSHNGNTFAKDNVASKSEYYEEFLQQLNDWTKGLNLKLPPPCHLKYRYPSPTGNALCNITYMLTAVPKFYTQVLHLMNKMNLPCPFEPNYPIEDNKIFTSFVSIICDMYGHYDDVKESSSELESELESEIDNTDKNTIAIPKKRKLGQRKKAFKRPKISKPVSHTLVTSKTTIPLEEVFETMDQELSQKKIEVKVPEKINVEQIEETVTEPDTSGFGIMYPSKLKEPEEQNVSKSIEENEKNEELDSEHFITSEKLAANRISERDWKMLSVFKNYQVGNASCRLYIKNLSRHVTQSDLSYIYKRYFIKGIDEQGTMFDIRLMQEGRMKGQAFITLQNIKQAQLALKETNGYILKDKPMVVQFARSASSK